MLGSLEYCEEVPRKFIQIHTKTVGNTNTKVTLFASQAGEALENVDGFRDTAFVVPDGQQRLLFNAAEDTI